MTSTQDTTLTIGEVAPASGVPAKTIRYYEQISLMPEPERAANGYRIYAQPTVERLRFIKRARDLGFPIADVTELLSLYDDPNRSAGDVRNLAKAHIAVIDAKLEELSGLRRTLSTLVNRCHGTDRPDCPILHDLEHHLEPS
jgi:MerR family copper efflux transcriptional regulator